MSDDHEGDTNQPSDDAERLAHEVRLLAHDINNALMPVLMGISVLRKKVGNPALEETLMKMEASVRNAADVTNKILALGHRYSK